MRCDFRIERWPLRKPFRTTGNVFTEAEVMVVQLGDGDAFGRGEALGVRYKGDTIERMCQQAEGLAEILHRGIGRQELQTLLRACGARNAIDCALWELEARRVGQPVWSLAGLPATRPLLTTYTIGADEPQSVASQAAAFTDARAIKLKLTGDALDAERVQAARAARPDVWLGIDANQGFTRASLERLMPILVDAGVQLIEQPFPIGRESNMDVLRLPIPVAADESAQEMRDLPALVGRFDVINIKLDKCGGLTHALDMAHEARRLGFKVMVGNMTGTSWSQAPAFVLGQLCDIVDLDGPLFLASDRTPAVTYEDGHIHCPDEVWGF